MVLEKAANTKGWYKNEYFCWSKGMNLSNDMLEGNISTSVDQRDDPGWVKSD